MRLPLRWLGLAASVGMFAAISGHWIGTQVEANESASELFPVEISRDTSSAGEAGGIEASALYKVVLPDGSRPDDGYWYVGNLALNVSLLPPFSGSVPPSARLWASLNDAPFAQIVLDRQSGLSSSDTLWKWRWYDMASGASAGGVSSGPMLAQFSNYVVRSSVAGGESSLKLWVEQDPTQPIVGSIALLPGSGVVRTRVRPPGLNLSLGGPVFVPQGRQFIMRVRLSSASQLPARGVSLSVFDVTLRPPVALRRAIPIGEVTSPVDFDIPLTITESGPHKLLIDVRGAPGNAPPGLFDLVVGGPVRSDSDRGQSASPVVGVILLGTLIAFAVGVRQRRERYAWVAMGGLVGVAGAEVLVMSSGAGRFVPLIFAPTPIFVIVTVMLAAHRVSWDAAALGLATLVFVVYASVFEGDKENPVVVVAAVAGLVFAFVSLALAIASWLFGRLIVRGLSRLRPNYR